MYLYFYKHLDNKIFFVFYINYTNIIYTKKIKDFNNKFLNNLVSLK